MKTNEHLNAATTATVIKLNSDALRTIIGGPEVGLCPSCQPPGDDGAGNDGGNTGGDTGGSGGNGGNGGAGGG